MVLLFHVSVTVLERRKNLVLPYLVGAFNLLILLQNVPGYSTVPDYCSYQQLATLYQPFEPPQAQTAKLQIKDGFLSSMPSHCSHIIKTISYQLWKRCAVCTTFISRAFPSSFKCSSVIHNPKIHLAYNCPSLTWWFRRLEFCGWPKDKTLVWHCTVILYNLQPTWVETRNIKHLLVNRYAWLLQIAGFV